MAKRYYWLKLKEDFFTQKEIKRLRRIAGGDTYTIIYLKLLLLSLKTEGKIYFEGIGDDFIDELALDLDEDIENVKMTISYLESKGIMEVMSDSEYFMNQIPSMIGSETDKAQLMRNKRAREKALNGNIVTQNSNNVTEPLPNRYTEIEKEKEKELEIDKEQEKERNPHYFYEQNFGVITPFLADAITKWCNELNEELVIEAMKIAKKKQKPFNYAEAILRNWEHNNINSIQDVEAESKQFERETTKGGGVKSEIGRSSYN